MFLKLIIDYLFCGKELSRKWVSSQSDAKCSNVTRMRVRYKIPIAISVVSLSIAIVVLVIVLSRNSTEECIRQFPEDFKFGAATSAYQIEGAWNTDGKGESIWDHICHAKPEFIDDRSNGDVACISYHLFQRDVDILKELGVKYYKFSLSWARIAPDGLVDELNSFGVEYYRNLIQLLVKNEIEPIVTLYHWDLPQELQYLDGWLNPDIGDYFGDYARAAFQHFGEEVKTWITINDPIQVCGKGYGEGTMAPGIVSPGEKLYLCAHNLLKAHARAWRIYDEEFRASQNGRISISIDTPWFEPKNYNDDDHIEAAERALQFVYGWYANPIYKRNYPQVMIDRIGNRSGNEDSRESRLPVFTDAELDYISGTYDFMGLGHYTTYLTEPDPEPDDEISFWNDLQVIMSQPKKWATGASDTFRVVPWGLAKLLIWINKAYAGPEIIITGNGFSDRGVLDDQDRISYFVSYLDNVLDSIFEEDVKVTTYIAWSLMDSFEWTRGYTERFGLYYVNFSDPERTRTAKSSVQFYKEVIRTNSIPCITQKELPPA